MLILRHSEEMGGYKLMDVGTLMAKLVELERRTESIEARSLVLAMQDEVMELERNLIAALSENLRLKALLRGRSKTSGHRHAAIPFSTTKEVDDLFTPRTLY